MTLKDNTYKLKALWVAFSGNWIARYIKTPLQTFWLTAFYYETYQQQKIKLGQIGVVATCFNLCMAIAALSMGPLSSALGRRPCILACLL